MFGFLVILGVFGDFLIVENWGYLPYFGCFGVSWGFKLRNWGFWCVFGVIFGVLSVSFRV